MIQRKFADVIFVPESVRVFAYPWFCGAYSVRAFACPKAVWASFLSESLPAYGFKECFSVTFVLAKVTKTALALMPPCGFPRCSPGSGAAELAALGLPREQSECFGYRQSSPFFLTGLCVSVAFKARIRRVPDLRETKQFRAAEVGSPFKLSSNAAEKWVKPRTA
jgi:hypothetical protein